MSKDSSKRDIAKQFDLPERQSKIATLLKQTDVYCICRSTDSTRFMIACDCCEEWYHGDCINITESDSRFIKQYFCPPCMEKNPSLEIEYKKAKPTISRIKGKSSSSASKSKDHKDEKASKSGQYSGGCGSCTGCLTVIDCGKCDRCKKSQKYGDKRRLCRKRECSQKDGGESDYEKPVERKAKANVLSERQVDVSDEEDDWKPSPVKKQVSPTKRGKKQQRKVMKEAAKEKSRRKTRTKRRRDPSSSEEETEESSEESEEEERQCLWLDCVNAARPTSKYCSQECCLKLATERLYRILPGRIQEWNLTPSIAEQHNKRDLEEVHKKQLDTRSKITDLEQKRRELDQHIEKVQQLTVDPDMEDEEPEEDGIIHCITCGHEIPIKSCLKHMERCYNKYESQTSFGSIYKTKLEGIPIFCDFFNPLHGTYCKRLQVLCPEHSKEPKVMETEICGSPFVKNMFESSSKFCQLPKKKCNKHFCWEKLRRAEIDMERVRNWLKLDELLEQERQLRVAIASRGSVMALMLHSTFDHDLRNRIQSQMQEGQSQPEGQKTSNPTTPTKVESEDEEDEEVDAESISLGSPSSPDEDEDEDEENFVREPLVKNRDKERRKSIAERDRQDASAKNEITASKLYKNIVSSNKN